MNSRAGLNLYLAFVASWFLHLTARVPALGAVRFDLLLVCLLAALALAQPPVARVERSPVDRLLPLLLAYTVVTLPFVEWPGTVIRTGLPNLVKAVIFYYFSIRFIRTERDLKRFIAVFLACQTLRVLEPLYLHLTQGYWGSVAYMDGGEAAMDRLAGAPSDVVNPNGLAFVICTALPFLYFLGGLSWAGRLGFALAAPACLYALVLTGSRTGLVGLAIVYAGLLWHSRRRVLLGAAGVAAVLAVVPTLDGNTRDRYLSIVGLGAHNAATAEARWEGVASDFEVALRRPLFGHGLGTSAEANAHFAGIDQVSHNLYAEVAQELGFVGLLLVVLLIVAVFSSLARLRRLYGGAGGNGFMPRLMDAVQVWLAVSVLFSFASYGLSSYEWYLLAGLAVVMQQLAHQRRESVPDALPAAARPVLYLDFDETLCRPMTGPPAAWGPSGTPPQGAIEFLHQAVQHFQVVVCSPYCRRADGAGLLAGWLGRHGAPVRQLRFSAGRLPGSAIADRVIPVQGRWPTMQELGVGASTRNSK